MISIGSAQAGDSWLEPSSVRVEEGDHLELTATVDRGALGWVDDGPFFVYLQGADFGTITSEGHGGIATDVPLGELNLDILDQRLTVSADVTIPQQTPPGEYSIVVCNDPCTTGLGDLLGAFIYVATDPPVLEDEAGLSTSTAAPNAATVALPAMAEPTTRPLSQRLTIAPYPDRQADMSPLWVGISAALAGAVLLTSLLSRQRS